MQEKSENKHRPTLTNPAAVPFPVLIIATHFLNWSPFLADGESKMEPELIIKQFGGIVF